ncbi:hypothetical protein ACS0TY_003823 [Phlomoides rotata]
MDEEKVALLGIESAEKCESIPELNESSAGVDGERGETVSVGDRPVALEGGEESVLEDRVALGDLELPVFAAEEGDSELIAPQGGSESLKLKTEEETKRVDENEGEAVGTAIRGAPAFAESQVDTKGDELQLDPEPIMKAEEFAPVVSESRMDGKRDEILVHTQLEKTAEEESKLMVDAEIEVVDTDADYEQQLSKLLTDARGAEMNVVSEGMEEWKIERVRELDGEQNVEAVDNESVEVENNVKSVEGDGEEKVDVVVNESEVGTAEKPTGVEEEKTVPGIPEEIPNTEVERREDMITEVNADEVNTNEQEKVQESSNGIEYIGGDERCDHDEDKEVASENNLMSETMLVNDENFSMDELSNTKIDEPLDVADYKEDVLVKVELPAVDIKSETEASVELESTSKAVVEEIQPLEAEVETETGNNFVTDKTPDEDGKLDTGDTMSDVDELAEDMYDSTAGLQDDEDEEVVAEEETGTQDTEMETETDMAESGKTSAGKRKRGKLSKSPSVSKSTAKASSRKIVGDDVCFICFDGGELVLCDRRGCPKAYHPSCVNRDEAFFKSKGRWNCGWHLCSNCEKNARYMCYTCTFSLCKSCIKDGVILCVRGNKGFCESCMRTVMLIEKKEQGSQDTPIDFDDRSSWEYLFKDYYIELKDKLSLSSVEIAEAKNPYKGTDMSGPSKQESSEAQPDANDGGSGSDNSIENSVTIRPKRQKTRKQSKTLSRKEELVGAGVLSGDKPISLSNNSEWASKELLDLVSHMKDGDMSVLSQFDVQAILLEYIKRNKLRDPRRKSQIICDARLENLFGKPRVGHFEMLKLLESHFLIRDEQNDDFQGSVVDTENNQLDIDVSAESLSKGAKDRKRKARRKDNRGPQSNLDDYAAIDMHNIGLIYLRRKLMEDLLEDAETFQDKVIGTFVRIRISGSTQKQDLYRLVQVVGTSKAAEPYKVGKRTTDIMVEILNLDKTEIISIDTISNQEFTEEECKRLRQSIKCGLISRLNVGEILDKTMEIQVARVNDWLESEILRLSHLSDRASDLGRRKELRECVEKLQLLKTPEERRRRLEEIPEIHADPKMDPSYESEEKDSENEDIRRDAFMRSRGSGFSRRGRGPISPGSDNSFKDSWSGAGKVTPNRNLSGSSFSINASHIGEIVNEHSWNLEREKETQESNHSSDKLNFMSNPESANWALRNASRSESSVPLQGSNSAGVVEPWVKINESEKMWHYQDPSGKVQGPFSMVQLRKWNNTGYFPGNLKIWRTTEKQENSILIADALAGKIPKESQSIENALHSSHTLAGHSGIISGTSLDLQEKERSKTDQSSASLSKFSVDKWPGNDLTNLPSPTPKQSNSGLITGALQSLAANGVLQSPTPAVLPTIGAHSSPPASVLNSVIQTTAFSPTPISQQGILVGTQSTTINDPHIAQMHGHPPPAVQPVQSVANQNLQADTQVWVSSGAQPGQQQGYGWTPSNIQNSSGSFSSPGPMAAGIQPDVWRPVQTSQPNIHPPATSWAMGPADNNTSMGVRPQNPNVGWGPMQANPNMGWVNPMPGNTNVNWGPGMQVPPPGGTSGWVPPPANPGGWVAPQGWVGPPVQGPVPGNGWGPLSGNAGAPPPVQVPSGNNANQGWAPWGVEQNHSGGQFSGPAGGQTRDSGFGGGRPWHRQSSFGGGGSGSRNKRGMLCPFNVNGRCKKGARCDFMHA